MKWIKVTWATDAAGNLVTEAHGTKFVAVRHRTQYGWCWFEVYRNGTNTHQQFTECPSVMLVEVQQ